MFEALQGISERGWTHSYITGVPSPESASPFVTTQNSSQSWKQILQKLEHFWTVKSSQFLSCSENS